MKTLVRVILFPCLIAIFWFSLVPVVAIAQTRNSDSICYMQTEDGRRVDLSGLCQQVQPKVPAQNRPVVPRSQLTLPPITGDINKDPINRVSYPTAPNVYDYKAMREFDRQLYGD
ncbi:MAG: hypothetical protein ACRC8A_06645 [Microcoleaceae cyanobacterium]